MCLMCSAMDNSGQIELVVGVGGLLAILIPKKLPPSQMSVVHKLAPDFTAKAAAAKRWDVWAVLADPEWTGDNLKERPLVHRLIFCE